MTDEEDEEDMKKKKKKMKLIQGVLLFSGKCDINFGNYTFHTDRYIQIKNAHDWVTSILRIQGVVALFSVSLIKQDCYRIHRVHIYIHKLMSSTVHIIGKLMCNGSLQKTKLMKLL